MTRCGMTAALQYDMIYGILLMRILYFWRDPKRLPAVEDVEAGYSMKPGIIQILGHGTPEQFIESYEMFVTPYLSEIYRTRSH